VRNNHSPQDSRYAGDRTQEHVRERKMLRPPGYDVNKRLWIPERERMEQHQKTLNYVRELDEEDASWSATREDWNGNAIQRDLEMEDEAVLNDERQHDGVEQLVNAIQGERADRQKGCFFKFMHGECTKRDCTMDHSEDTIQAMWKKRIWDLAKAAKSPGAEVLVAELQRAVRDAQGTSTSNTRA